MTTTPEQESLLALLAACECPCHWCDGKGTEEGSGYPPAVLPCRCCEGTKRELTPFGLEVIGFVRRLKQRGDL